MLGNSRSPPRYLKSLRRFLEALEIADGHAVAQKTLLDGVEGVDGGAIGVEDDQLVAVRGRDPCPET